MSESYDGIDERDRRALVEVLDADESEVVVANLERALVKAEHEKVKYYIRNTLQKILTTSTADED